MGPRLVVNCRDVSADVTNVYSDGHTKKYHLNDLKIYTLWTDQLDISLFPVGQTEATEYEMRLTMLDIDPAVMKFAGRPGSQYLDLTHPYDF
jgi:hypothetical protein